MDSLSETLDIRCSWIHLAGQAGKNPYLASYRNFTEDMLHSMSHINRKHPLFKEVMGLGNKILIPNLNMDGIYGMTAFEKAGFCSLAAVPITTYKVLGILGAADKKKKKFDSDFAQLFATIASLVGVSLTRDAMMEKTLTDKTVKSAIPEPKTNTPETSDIENNKIVDPEIGDYIDSDAGEKQDSFKKHVRRMGRFREQHK